MAGSSPESVVQVTIGSNQERLTPEIRALHPLHLSSILSGDLAHNRSRASSAASTTLLNTPNNNNNNVISDSNYTDTITSTRSRHLSFSRLSYNLSTFNKEFDKIPKEKTNSFLKVVADPRSLVRTISNTSVSRTASERPDDNEDGLQDNSYGLEMSTTRKDESDVSWKECCLSLWSRQRLLLALTSLFPILRWGREYSIRDNLVSDVISGLTIIVFHVPQSMGYSLIAHVSPVYGLYTAFFPALIYSLMGTSKHCAIGMFAVISLMTGTLILEAKEELALATGRTSDDLTITTTALPLASLSGGEDEAMASIRIAVAVSFLIGFYQLVFGILQMGFISVYLSEQLVSGFTTAASLYVFTSQLPFLFGIHLPHRSGPLALVTAYTDLFAHMHEANLLTVSISLTCCVILIVFKFYVNEKIHQRLGIDIPFPIELILVIIGTTASFCLQVEDIEVVGPIPSGLPAPAAPDWSLMIMLAKKSIPLAIVAYTLTISVGKIFAARHRYEIDANQELMALGCLNLFSCFFSCLPSAASLSRSAVQESAGGKTQVVSIINCIGILFVLYFAGSLLEKLPICILASIIAVALKSLFAQVADFVRYWRVSKLDASIWLVTFVAVVLLDVDLGLYVGLAYSLLTLIYKSQRPKTYLLGSVGASDVYVPERKYASATRIPGILIYQFCGPLHFANTEFFQKDLTAKTGVSVPEIQKQMERQERRASIRRDDDSRKGVKRSPSGKSSIRSLTNEDEERKSKHGINWRQLDGVEDDENKELQPNEGPEPVVREDNDVEIGFSDQDPDAVCRDLDDKQVVRLATRDGDPLPSHIIIDCSMFSYIDTAGVSQLKRTVQDYQSIGVKAFLAGIATHVDNMLQLDGFYREVPSHHVYITIHDAVHHAQQEQLGVDLKDCPQEADDDEASSLNDSTSCVSKTEENTAFDSMNRDTGRRLFLSPSVVPSGHETRSPANGHKSCNSLPVPSSFQSRRSIVGFFEETIMPQPQQPLMTGMAGGVPVPPDVRLNH